MPTDDKFAQLALLAYEQGVRFHLDSDSTQWPETHSGIYAKVHYLDTIRYSQYRDEAQQNLESEPWKSHKVKKAKKISQLAQQCIQERQIEHGWRLKLEHHIFETFEYGLSW